MNSGFSISIGILFTKIVAKFSFVFICFFSDAFYLLGYYIISYRKSVVLKNIGNAFPKKIVGEIKSIPKILCHHFCDLTLETITMKGMKVSELVVFDISTS